MMNSTASSPASPDTDADPTPDSTRPRINLSLTQLLASALAAITATVAASFLGVAGTVIGAAVASVLTVVGNAVYGHSLQRTGERVATAVPVTRRLLRAPSALPPPPPSARRPAPARRPFGTWKTLAAACLGVFAGVLLVVTAVEVVAGRPLTDLVRGKQGTGTSLLGNVSQTTKGTTPSAPVTITITPTVVTATPTVTVTGNPVTQTATPTTTTTPSGSPSSPSPSDSSGSVSPSSSATTSATPTRPGS